ncbi:phosphocholine cytidylyltransferase family protein [Microvenator marinus]|uniref:Phosphocholine cytidylyltransferase family protein n=1 Tax=Microvenator marinus TaxID=2600177 RepID=A0A5B8XVI5_9DELT|nr:phosphocholine cytidylyltransferase family protein [Microvenator marinus]QED29630.1 phosphocholine cytidylyltransferase family protein [Microvenator marinus]
MKAIIIAAGMGSRLEHHTNEKPKCMVEVNSMSILDHQLHALRSNGISEFHVIRGYLADKLILPEEAGEKVKYFLNEKYRENNILFSLMYAKESLEGDVITTYSDIVYTPEVVAKLAASTHDISLVIDRQWALAYEGRDDHPVEQAELAICEGEKVLRVGKQVGPEGAAGEFIGLAKFNAKGAEIARTTWERVRAQYEDDQPFQAAKLFRKAYLTDLILELIADGADVGAVFIDGGWREIDTVQDLERVNSDTEIAQKSEF